MKRVNKFTQFSVCWSYDLLCVIWKDFFNCWHQSGSHSIAKRREGRRRRNREIEKWEDAVLGSMMEDTGGDREGGGMERG